MSGLPRTVEISTNELVQAMAKELREMTQAIRKVLQDTPPELRYLTCVTEPVSYAYVPRDI